MSSRPPCLRYRRVQVEILIGLRSGAAAFHADIEEQETLLVYGGFSDFGLVDRRDVFDLDIEDAAIGLEVVPDRLGLLLVVGGDRECAGLDEAPLLVEELATTF